MIIDLIKGVIAQSGTALSNWALMPHFLNARRGKILAGNLGCDTYDIEEMMACLTEASARDIIEGAQLFYVSLGKRMFILIVHLFNFSGTW